MGSISSGAEDCLPSSPAQSISSAKSHPNASSLSSYTSIAIWSRRPGDPSKAPGIIISPRAQPPEIIMSKALDIPTPPASPKPVSVPLPVDDWAPDQKEDKIDHATTMLANSAISSSAVTEVTDVPTLPGSPMSTNTSVSGAGGSSTKDDTGSVPTVAATEDKTTLGDATNAEAVPSGVTESTSAAAAESAATVIKTPPPKSSAPKSWASLFSSSTGTSAASPSQRTGLPTSSVIGFSIPASPTNPSLSPIVPVIPTKKSELLNLLTNGPGGGGLDKIRTRGLINSGNMCFANAVLQVLVYCAPFQRLFIELGKTLVSQEQQQTSSASAVPPVASSSSSGVTVIPNGPVRSPVNGTTTPKSGKSQTPFIDATVEFLKEFVVEEGQSNSGKKAKKNKDGFSNQVNGRSGRTKGKEKEIAEIDGVEGSGDGTDGDDWPESFLPSYVYEAMKEKKRFENMRSGQQEDAEEFLGFYLDTLEEELLSIQNSLAPPPPKSTKEHTVEEREELEPPAEDGWLEVGKKNRMIITRTIKATESPITRMFGGKFKSTLKAPGQKDSVLVEDWRSLRLDIQPDSIHTIQEALTHITHPQSIQMTHSSRPGITIDANQKVLIEALPPVLVLHVKRFWYDIAVGGVVKVMKQVRFEPELEIGSDMMVQGKRSAKYRLFGVIYHHGHSASGGHYTLDILHQNRYPGAKLREGWVRIDDELVSDVRSEDVFDAWEKDEMRNAYLLFYRRIRS